MNRTTHGVLVNIYMAKSMKVNTLRFFFGLSQFTIALNYDAIKLYTLFLKHLNTIRNELNYIPEDENCSEEDTSLDFLFYFEVYMLI